MSSSVGSRRVAAAVLAAGITASAAAAQARIERVIGAPTGALVQLAGASHDNPADTGQMLQPGDMLKTDPNTRVELRCTSAAEVAAAIKTLAIRGAPAIGIAAAYGFALAAQQGEDLEAAYDCLLYTSDAADEL